MDGWAVRTRYTSKLRVAMAVAVAVGMLAAGCAATVQKEPPAPSPSQVRSNADRAFEKLKQEERERQIDSSAVSK